MRTQQIGDVHAIRDVVEVPGFGALPINAFVLHGDEPVLVDTGRPVERQAFLDALSSVIDPSTIRWIWLTHPDRDHMGALFDVLAMAPNARLVTTFIAAGYLSVEFPMPLDRIQLVNPGQALEMAGGRRLHAFRPPLFDSPMTVGFFDDATGFCVSSDCFGALLPTPDVADADDARELDPAVLRAGQVAWGTGDSPWVATVDPAKFAATYDVLRRFSPDVILSTHLPPATAQLDTFVDFLEMVPSAAPLDAPEQAFLDGLLQQLIEVPEQATATTPVA
jgi:hypothetical protein